jgi:heat shock protein HslJ
MHPRSTVLVLVALALLLCTAGCSQLLASEPRATPSITRQPSEPTPFPTIPPRFGPPTMTWYLVSLQDANGSFPVIPGTTITAFFDGQGSVSGTAGCNQYRASYADGGNGTLTVGPPASTEKACSSPEGATAQEARYLAALQSARSYRVDGLLRLADARGGTLLTFSPTPGGTPVDAPLNMTGWYATSFVDAAGRTYSPAGLTTIRLVFGNDGTLYGNAGCNNHYGPYRTTGEGTIVIGDQQATRVYCGIGGVMELERAYLALLPNMTRYTIAGDTLRLSDGSGPARWILS